MSRKKISKIDPVTTSKPLSGVISLGDKSSLLEEGLRGCYQTTYNLFALQKPFNGIFSNTTPLIPLS